MTFGITESKLDSSFMNVEVNINGYTIIRNDRNRSGCYIKNDSTEHVFLLTLEYSTDLLNILTNSSEKIYKKEMIDVGILDHQFRV